MEKNKYTIFIKDKQTRDQSKKTIQQIVYQGFGVQFLSQV